MTCQLILLTVPQFGIRLQHKQLISKTCFIDSVVYFRQYAKMLI